MGHGKDIGICHFTTYVLLMTMHTKICVTNIGTGFKQRNSTIHYKTIKQPSFTVTFTGDLTAHCATRLTRNTSNQTSKLTVAHTNTILTSSLPQNMFL